VITNTGSTEDCWAQPIFSNTTLYGLPTVAVVNSPPTPVLLPPGGTLEFDIELQVDAASDATDEELFWYYVESDFSCVAQEYLCVIPDNETTFSSSSPPPASLWPPLGNGGWSIDTNKQTIHRWGAELTPITADFSGREIQEASPPGSVVDDRCWLSGADGNKAGLSNGKWTVSNGSYYGIDWVGWFQHKVSYYRSQGRSPCYAEVPQQLEIKCHRINPSVPTAPIEYWHAYTDHDLMSGIDQSCLFLNQYDYIYSRRDNGCENKYWP
jgi:hypothetical protein